MPVDTTAGAAAVPFGLHKTPVTVVVVRCAGVRDRQQQAQYELQRKNWHFETPTPSGGWGSMTSTTSRAVPKLHRHFITFANECGQTLFSLCERRANPATAAVRPQGARSDVDLTRATFGLSGDTHFPPFLGPSCTLRHTPRVLTRTVACARLRHL